MTVSKDGLGQWSIPTRPAEERAAVIQITDASGGTIFHSFEIDLTVSVHPKLTHLEKMAESPPPNAPAGQKLMIQKPQFQSREMNTTVSIPNGATFVLGWQEPAGGKEDPHARFDVAGQRISTDQILILVRPTLVIHQEVEDKQFPLLNTKPQR